MEEEMMGVVDRDRVHGVVRVVHPNNNSNNRRGGIGVHHEIEGEERVGVVHEVSHDDVCIVPPPDPNTAAIAAAEVDVEVTIMANPHSPSPSE